MNEVANTVDGKTRLLAEVSGVVQGVGFRPFVYRLARARSLTGRVMNTSAGVQIEIEGTPDALDGFLAAIEREAPPMSRISGIEVSSCAPAGYSSFEIGKSTAVTGQWQPVSPDSCTCTDCLSELFDPADRRYRYPFINCTSCGPRFTIIEALPYDRPLTTMSSFDMCPECLAEYRDPADRRFHAEPNACPACGPSLWLTGLEGRVETADPVAAAAAALRDGAIIAVKGLGGFQLACLAADDAAVLRLRQRKARPDKPFAVMVASTEAAANFCRVSPEERQVLESAERPIVLLERIGDAGDISPSVAPRLGHLGIMLPGSPLHFLLMDEVGLPLIMTSGNLSEEPICRTNGEAVERLAGIADLFLLHDRGINSTYDDSVVMLSAGEPVMIRRARGYAPLPVALPGNAGADEPVLAVGGELKNTFCLTRGGQAIVSQHIGDLNDAGTLLHFENTISLYQRLFSVTPRRVACDSHPDYLSTTYAQERTEAPRKVQHHRAHVAACLAENGWQQPAIGVALDGTGYGDDGKIWGGEFFTGSLSSGFDRVAHFEYMPLPGSDAAVREPWRTALGAVWRFVPDEFDAAAQILGVDAARRELMRKQLWAGLNCPQTSSAGRLFDAVAALVVSRNAISYEAQAAMELEALAAGAATEEAMHYTFDVERESVPWTISPRTVIAGVLEDLTLGREPARIALGFHMAVAEVIVRLSKLIAGTEGYQAVAVTGGVWQNRLLLDLVRSDMAGSGLQMLSHKSLPPGDGGISYGQAAMTIYQSRR